MRLSGYNKNLENVYKNYTYITKKGEKKKRRTKKKGINGKNREENGKNSSQREDIFKSFDGYNSMQPLKRHTQGLDLLHCMISHVGLLKQMEYIVLSLFHFITCSYSFTWYG